MTLSPRNSRRNPMLREVDDLGDLCPRLEGEHRADLCIVGGGYLGLWTALEIKAAEPSMEICVIEADICGGGASGRNSGMALPWWTKIEALIAQCGTDEGLRLARASVTAIDEIAAFADTHRFDIEFARTGWLWGSTSPREDGRWGGIIDALDHHGEAHFAELDRAGVEALVDAPGFRGGALDAACATLHPAKLVRGPIRSGVNSAHARRLREQTNKENPMSEVRLYKRDALEYKTSTVDGTTTQVCRAIGSPVCTSMGAGHEILETVQVPWTTLYDEVIFMTEGELHIHADGKTTTGVPGDIIWLPKGTELIYDAPVRAAYFYALYPVDWAAQNGMEEP